MIQGKRKTHFQVPGIVFHINAKEAEIEGKKILLTKSEYEICEYLALHHGQTFTREQIYETVFGFDGESDSGVISAHIKNIRGKLAVLGVTPIKTVWGWAINGCKKISIYLYAICFIPCVGLSRYLCNQSWAIYGEYQHRDDFTFATGSRNG